MVNEGATRGEGTHKVCPYGWTMAAHQRRAHTRCAPTGGLWPRTRGGHTQGVLLRVDYGRAPGEGTHKVCPYGWLMKAPHGGRAHTRCAPTGGLWPPRVDRGGHTQGVLLRVDYGRAPGEGTHKVCSYGWSMKAPHGGEGTHKVCPYGWITTVHTGNGHPQGAPLQARFLLAVATWDEMQRWN